MADGLKLMFTQTHTGRTEVLTTFKAFRSENLDLKIKLICNQNALRTLSVFTKLKLKAFRGEATV
jgi:hypothetical protein